MTNLDSILKSRDITLSTKVRLVTAMFFPVVMYGYENIYCLVLYNNLRYADDTTLMAESEEELKSLLMKVKEESEKVGFISTFRKLR